MHFSRLHKLILTISSAFCFAPAVASAAEIVNIQGEKIVASRVHFLPGFKINAEAPDKAHSFEGLDLLSITFGDPTDFAPPKGSQLIIGDDEILVCNIVESDIENLTVQSPLIGGVRIPLTGVRGAILDASASQSKADTLRRQIRQAKGIGDVVRLQNNDLIQGTLLDVQQKTILFDREGNELRLQRELVQTIVFDPSLYAYSVGGNFHAQVRFRDGSVINVSDVESTGDSLKLHALCGVILTVPVADIVDVSFRNGKVVYLSDIAPAETVVEPYLDDATPPKMNASVLGTPLRLGSRNYSKGIGMRSRTTLRYGLDGKMSRFQAIVGVDTQAGPQASVLFRVLVDGKEAFNSETMTVTSEPKTVDVPLKEAKTLELQVDYADRGDVQDYANWCDARLHRE